jgi:membrane protease YdiL (CAAX protease family)
MRGLAGKRPASGTRFTPATAIALTLSLGGAFVPLVARPLLLATEYTSFQINLAFKIYLWVLALSVWAIALHWEKLAPEKVGLRRISWQSTRQAVGIGVLLVIGIIVAASLIFAILDPASQMEPLPAYSVGFWFFTVVTAAFTEETLYRAYPMGRLEALTGSVWPGAIITFVLFVIVHMGTNGAAEILFIIAPVAAALTGLYLWKRNFLFVVIVHFVVDSHLWIRPLLAAITDA